MYNIKKGNIVLRQFNGDDFSQFFNKFCNDPQWTRMFPIFKLDNKSAEVFFGAHVNSYSDINLLKSIVIFGIFKEEELIGMCGYEHNKESKSIEVFFGLTSENRGKGYAKDMLNAICELSKEIGIEKIYANVSAADEVLNKVLESSLFVFKRKFVAQVANMTFEINTYMYN